MGAQDIGILSLFSFFLLFIPVLLIGRYLKLGLNTRIVTSCIRMCLQLGFVGLYLAFLFRLNSPLLNSVYLLIMVMTACSTVLRSSHLRINIVLMPLFLALVIPFIIVLFFFHLLVVELSALFDARYLIPIGLVSLPGMMTGQILGGSLPIVAIKYQIAIMAAIFYTEFLSVLLSLALSLPWGFTGMNVLRTDIFTRQA